MTNEERELWLKLAQGIEEKIMASKPLPQGQLERYWALRRVDPLIQMKWEAATVVDPATSGKGQIIFPNGNRLNFNGVRVRP